MINRILIGEDNLISQQVMEALLESRCKDVRAVSTYSELIAALEEVPYDLLLLDYHLDQDADFTVSQIRQANSVNKNIPIIILSAEPESVVLEKMHGLTISGYIKKPVNPEQLDAALHGSVRKAQPEIVSKSESAIDLSQLETLLGNSPERVERIVRIFMNEVHDYFHKMEELLDRNELRELKTLVHRARASYGYLGLHSLHRQLTWLESKIESGKDQETYQGSLDRIKADTAEIIKELKKMFPTLL